MNNFDTDNQNWYVSKGGTGGYSTTGGNPGGYVFGDDVGGPAWYFVASTDFVTEVRKSYDRTLRFDLKQAASDSRTDAINDVILTDGKHTLTFKTAYKPRTTWTNYAIGLNDASGWKNGSLKATKAEIQLVLQNLTGLWIRGDYKAGAVRGGLDNAAIY